MKIPDFLGDDIMNLIDSNSIWLSHPSLEEDKCNIDDFDASFFDAQNRVEKKYNAIPEYEKYDKMSLIELTKLLNPPRKGRIIILGTTEYLFPYVAYCIKFIKENNLSIENGNRSKLPFIFFALLEWTEEKNIDYIDCLSHYYKHKDITIHVFISKDKNKWVNQTTNIPRITIYELIRFYNKTGNIDISVYSKEPDMYKLIIKSTIKKNEYTRRRRKKGFFSKHKRIKLRQSRKSSISPQMSLSTRHTYKSSKKISPQMSLSTRHQKNSLL